MPSAHSPSLWDSIAGRYDDLRPDQGLTDPAIRAAWLALLEPLLPRDGHILDLGSGTGSLTLLLAERGYSVTGLDFAPAMVARAREKAEALGVAADFVVADATAPAFAPQSIAAIVSRQTLWALPDRAAALDNWADLLVDGGRLVLIEGRFASGNGMSEAELLAALPGTFSTPDFTDLSSRAELWGAPLSDQRLLATATRLPR
jgi:ubiquinone/menaquinone biosynthesis C-methylase UbiE